MSSFGELLGQGWTATTGLQWKSNWFKRAAFGFSSALALAMFFITYASEGKYVDEPIKNKLRDVMLVLIPVSYAITFFGNLMDPKDDKAPLLPIFRGPQDAIDGLYQDIREQQLIVASVQMASVNLERRVNELALENQMLRRWANY